MIKKIRTDQVCVGMYITQLDCDWIDHSFLSRRFKVKDPPTITRLVAEGVAHVYIDTEKGIDLVGDPADEPLSQLAATPPEPHAPELATTATEERNRARAIYGDATVVVKQIMGDVRLGRQINLSATEPITERMIASVLRNPHALTSVVRIKSKEQYTFMHSVGVAAIMIAFARHLDLPADEICEIARGALLHDVGKILIPDTVLNKPGALTDEEFEVMRSHAALGVEVLRETAGFSAKSMEPVAMHHERNDGSGYPNRLKGDQITLVGQMSAIVDLYDALTSLRVYKGAWEPSVALKKMLEWTPAQFDAALMERFIRFLGIYPVGSLVALDSGVVGIVTEQGDDLLRPQLLVIYDGRHRHYVKPQRYDLQRHLSDRILGVVLPSQYGIDVASFI